MSEKYIAYTLIDITKTGNTNPRSSKVDEYNQQQNLNTLIQLIGLRSQPIHTSVTKKEAQDLAQYQFGNQFNGLHTVWKFEFIIEHSQVYENNSDPVYFLCQDCDGAAFTPYLTETVNFLTATFETRNPQTLNIYFFKCD